MPPYPQIVCSLFVLCLAAAQCKSLKWIVAHHRDTIILVAMIPSAKAWLAPAMIAAVFAVAGSALAADKKPAPQKLPGVEGDYRIVKPHVPEPGQAPAGKTGGWDVKVSGTLTVDTGAGSLPLPRN
jgi:hypothetical protein